MYTKDKKGILDSLLEYSKEQIIDFNLLERGLIKTLKLKGNKTKNVNEFFRILMNSLEKRKESFKAGEPEKDDVFSFEPQEPSLVPKKVYREELYYLQVELLKLQEWLTKTGKTLIIVFEGRDSAGKGSTIKKFIENLNPRSIYFNSYLFRNKELSLQ
jgi:hypothetical protein